MAKELFGTDGIRGVSRNAAARRPDPFRYRPAHWAVFLLREHGSAHALIGMDTRESGPHIAAVLAAGLEKAGASADLPASSPLPELPAWCGRMTSRPAL